MVTETGRTTGNDPSDGLVQVRSKGAEGWVTIHIALESDCAHCTSRRTRASLLENGQLSNASAIWLGGNESESGSTEKFAAAVTTKEPTCDASVVTGKIKSLYGRGVVVWVAVRDVDCVKDNGSTDELGLWDRELDRTWLGDRVGLLLNAVLEVCNWLLLFVQLCVALAVCCWLRLLLCVAFCVALAVCCWLLLCELLCVALSVSCWLLLCVVEVVTELVREDVRLDSGEDETRIEAACVRDGELLGDCVELGVDVSEETWDGVCVVLAVRDVVEDELCEREGVALPVCVTVSVELPEGLRDGDSVPEEVRVCEGVAKGTRLIPRYVVKAFAVLIGVATNGETVGIR
jgi:hypothetical protein